MGNPRPPRLTQWRGYWYIFTYDWLEGKPLRVPCSKFNATTKRERELLLKRLQRQYIYDQADSLNRIGGADYKRRLLDAMDEFLEYIDEQEEVRKANPEARYGLSKSAAYTQRLAVNTFKEWLRSKGKANMPCDALTDTLLEKFFTHLVSSPFRAGGSTKKRSAAAVNNYRGRLGACLRWLDRQRPRLFPDFTIILPALKLRNIPKKPALAFTPKELKCFLEYSMKPLPPANIKRVRNGRKQTFKQSQSAFTATPVDRLFLLLACTGMRLGESLALRWDDLDLKSGRIIINAQKTAAWRLIPLINAPECEVAPAFLKTLKAWRKERPDAEYVLPHEGIDKPAYPKHAWERVRRGSKVNITPQKLRQNFVSYCASMGVPPAIAAMWCGHSAQVAERHYRLQLMDRKKANSIQGAMGI